MSTCKAISCCSNPIFSYSLQSYPVYTNEELTYFIPCPPGFECADGGVTITIPAGTISYRPTTPEDNTEEHAEEVLEELGEQIAQSQAYPQMAPTPRLYYNDEVGVVCSGTSIGAWPLNPPVPFYVAAGTVVIPAGTFSSPISQAMANSIAGAQAASILAAHAQCQWENTEQTVNCPAGMSGGPYVVPAGEYVSLISQADADAQALAAAQTMADQQCGGPCDIYETDNTVIGSFSPNVGTATSGDPVRIDVMGVNLPIGKYKIRYVNGAYSQHGINNADPTDSKKVWSGNRYRVRIDGNLVVGTPDRGVPVEYTETNGVIVGEGGDQAALEALWVGYESVEFIYNQGTLDLWYTYIWQVDPYYQGPASVNISGTPNPTFELIRTQKSKAGDLSQRVRVVNWAAVAAAMTICPAYDASAGEPAFGGDMPLRTFNGFATNLNWASSVSAESFQGKLILPGSVTWNDAECYWEFYIIGFEAGNPMYAYAYRKNGDYTPIGTYFKVETTSTGPTCVGPATIEIEEY